MKLLAARRSGIHNVVVPAENEVDAKEDLKTEQLGDVPIHYAQNMDELANLTLLPSESAANQS